MTTNNHLHDQLLFLHRSVGGPLVTRIALSELFHKLNIDLGVYSLMVHSEAYPARFKLAFSADFAKKTNSYTDRVKVSSIANSMTATLMRAMEAHPTTSNDDDEYTDRVILDVSLADQERILQAIDYTAEEWSVFDYDSDNFQLKTMKYDEANELSARPSNAMSETFMIDALTDKPVFVQQVGNNNWPAKVLTIEKDKPYYCTWAGMNEWGVKIPNHTHFTSDELELLTPYMCLEYKHDNPEKYLVVSSSSDGLTPDGVHKITLDGKDTSNAISFLPKDLFGKQWLLSLADPPAPQAEEPQTEE